MILVPNLYTLFMYYTFKTFKFDISCIVHNLGILGVAQKIQVIGSMQVDELFTVGSWT